MRLRSKSMTERTDDILPSIDVYHLLIRWLTKMNKRVLITHLHWVWNSALSSTMRATNPASPPSGYIISISAPVHTCESQGGMVCQATSVLTAFGGSSFSFARSATSRALP